jgi:hypothetical protein
MGLASAMEYKMAENTISEIMDGGVAEDEKARLDAAINTRFVALESMKEAVYQEWGL